jgi:pimeloyl-ACP methyl ester carboxylesterase
MDTITSLTIRGHRDLELANTFYKHALPPSRLAVLFPGQGYTCAMPLLFYAAQWFYAHGADVLATSYGFADNPNEFARLPAEDRSAWLGADAWACFQAAMNASPYDQVVLLGKSLGTIALANLALMKPSTAKADFVWLTPLARDPILNAAILQARPRSLFIQGTADPHYDQQAIEKLHSAVPGDLLLIPDADHSLHITGNFDATLDAVRQMLGALSAFTGW